MPYLEKYTARWKLNVLLMILGGIAGLLFARILPNRFQATGFLTASIDYRLTGSLTDIEADRMLGAMEDIIKSDEVISRVCQAESDCNKASFLNQIKLARTNDSWLLTVLAEPADEAVRLTASWMEQSHAALTACSENAAEARTLEKALDNLSMCVTRTGNQAAFSDCPADTAELFSRISETAQLLAEKQELSQGLSPAVVLGGLQNDPAEIIVRRAGLNDGLLTVLGFLIGLLVSLVIPFLAPESQKAAG